MNKKLSLFIGQFAGIRVFIHWTFWLILIWVFFSYYNINKNPQEGFEGVLFILALFACVVLHEFGHALTAKRYGIKTRNITLYPIGGVASLESLPEQPGREFMVAVAGPLVNVVIAGILWMYLSFSGQMPDFEALQNADPEDLNGMTLPFSFNLLMANVILVAFNLIPAFPMDGGRMLRALLAFKMERSKATRLAASIGQILAIAFIFLGFFYNFWLVIIGFFIYIGAGSEANMETIRTNLSDNKVRDVIMKKFSILLPQDTLEKAVRILLDSQEQEFIVAENEQVVGVLTRKELIKGLSDHGKNYPVSEVMSKDFMILHPEMPLKEVYVKMLTKGCSVGPVLEDGKLIGVVDKTNIDELLMVESALRNDDERSQ